MNNRDSFKSAISGLDQFNQASKTTLLWSIARGLLEQNDSHSVARGIMKFLELDLLRYGNFPTPRGIEQGFGAIRQSNALWSFIRCEIMPADPDYVATTLLSMLANGALVVGIKKSLGAPDFTFCLAGTQPMEGTIGECKARLENPWLA